MTASPKRNILIAYGRAATINPATASTSQKEKNMARRRYQTGEVFLRGKNPVWVGRWREDILENNKVRRCKRSLVLGTLQDIPTKRLALRALASHLEEVNAPTYQARSVLFFGDFIEQWEKTVVKTLKPSTASALS